MAHLIRVFAAALLLAFVQTGCARSTQAVATDLSEVSIRETVTVANPQAAVDEVYEALPEARTEELSDDLMRELFPDVQAPEFYGRISDPDGGLADMLILLPAEGARDKTRDALRQYQEKRMREFENYDILSAFEIAGDAVVIDQGEYVILLMLPDNDMARDILDRHLPL